MKGVYLAPVSIAPGGIGPRLQLAEIGLPGLSFDAAGFVPRALLQIDWDAPIAAVYSRLKAFLETGAFASSNQDDVDDLLLPAQTSEPISDPEAVSIDLLIDGALPADFPDFFEFV